MVKLRSKSLGSVAFQLPAFSQFDRAPILGRAGVSPMKNKRIVQAQRTGWLLASLAPLNCFKGRRMLASLSTREADIAREYARECVAVYLKDGSPTTRDAYAGHKYAV
jgi:hypothetical protein